MAKNHELVYAIGIHCGISLARATFQTRVCNFLQLHILPAES